MGDTGPERVSKSGVEPRTPEGARQGRVRVVVEVVALWLVTLLLIRGVVDVTKGAGLPDLVLALVPILFMYAPVAVCSLRGIDSYQYPLALPAFRDREPWKRALFLNAAVIVLIVVPWVAGYHLYQTRFVPVLASLGIPGLPKHGFAFQGVWPSSPLELVAYHIFFVAIPEEFFYRGYLQSRLDEIFGTNTRILGAAVGPGLLVTCVLFAFGHSLVQLQWWHFAIFFPSLVFGWMRARTGHIIAGAMFHAWCNVTVTTLDTLYGVIPPQP